MGMAIHMSLKVGNHNMTNINHGPVNNANIPIDRVMKIVRDICGPNMRFLVRPTYMKSNPEWIDLAYEFHRGFKMPNFTSGDKGQSTIEQIGRLTFQCGELGNDGFLKLRMFPSSLTRTTFTWYINLPPNSYINVKLWKSNFTLSFIRQSQKYLLLTCLN